MTNAAPIYCGSLSAATTRMVAVDTTILTAPLLFAKVFRQYLKFKLCTLSAAPTRVVAVDTTILTAPLLFAKVYGNNNIVQPPD